MATFNSDIVAKKIRHRGIYTGKEQTVTGSLYVKAGTSIATTDLINAVPLGENVRPIRILLQATTRSGTPVMTNPTFDVGVAPIGGTFTRPDGTTYPALSADTDLLSPDLLIAANTILDVAIPRPVADSVANYGPFHVTLTPSGVGAFSVAGGDLELQVSVVYLGEQHPDVNVYTSFAETKYKN